MSCAGQACGYGLSAIMLLFTVSGIGLVPSRLNADEPDSAASGTESTPVIAVDAPSTVPAPPADGAAVPDGPERSRDLSDRGFPLEWIEKAERRWTFPGGIREHLLDDRHGFTEEQIADLTDEELINLHSNHHIHELPAIGRKILTPGLIHEGTPVCTPAGNQLAAAGRSRKVNTDAQRACSIVPDSQNSADTPPEPPVSDSSTVVGRQQKSAPQMTARPQAPRPAAVRYTPPVRAPQPARAPSFGQRRPLVRGR